MRLELTDSAGKTLARRDLTLHVRNEGQLAEATRDSLRRSRAPLVVEVCDSDLYDYADEALAALFDRGPEAFEAHVAGLAEAGAGRRRRSRRCATSSRRASWSCPTWSTRLCSDA